MKDLERTFATTTEKYQNQLFSTYCNRDSLENLTYDGLKFGSIFNEFNTEVKMNLDNHFKLILNSKPINLLNSL
ncbi:hypothetical protein [Tenacibaculum xiamenense]|uniref:hypothetical protein n=1 Tax=Tenacibaculum xiamenense TaxID=1261553 RepID=UPI0038B5A4B4